MHLIENLLLWIDRFSLHSQIENDFKITCTEKITKLIVWSFYIFFCVYLLNLVHYLRQFCSQGFFFIFHSCIKLYFINMLKSWVLISVAFVFRAALIESLLISGFSLSISITFPLISVLVTKLAILGILFSVSAISVF